MRVRSRAFLWVVAVFLTGILFGGSSSFFLLRDTLSGAVSEKTAVNSDRKSRSKDPRSRSEKAFTRIIAEATDLDLEQQAQLRRVLTESIARHDDVNRKCDREHAVLREQARDQVRALLTPSQVEVFNAYLERRDREKKRKN